jgi:GNAT superfamily N-acetyltransferase
MKIVYKKINQENVITVNTMLSKYISSFKLKKDFNSIYKKLTLQKNNISIIACSKKKAIGYASINFNISIRGGVRGYINDVVVEKEYRKKGIGKSLINILLKYAKKKKCFKIILESKKKNFNFYRSCGYKLNSFTMRKLIK